MIFEILEECNDQNTVTVQIDNYTFNQILMMLVVEAYHTGQHKPKDKEIWGQTHNNDE